MKGILEFLAMFSLGRAFSLVRNLLKSYFLHAYISIIDGLRGVYFLLIASIFAVLLFFTGFIFLHIALFLYLSWTMNEKLLLMVILSAFYMLVTVVGVCMMQSRNRWLKISGVRSILDDLTDNKN